MSTPKEAPATTLSAEALELRRKYYREYCRKHRKENKEYYDKYREEHKEEITAYQRAYKKAHPEKNRDYQRRYWERKAAELQGGNPSAER